MLSLKIAVESAYPACEPDFLFAYFKSRYHVSYSKLLFGFMMFDTQSTFSSFIFFFFSFYYRVAFIKVLSFLSQCKLLYKCWISEKGVCHLPCENTVSIFQFMFALNLSLQLAVFVARCLNIRLDICIPEGFTSSLKCASLILTKCTVHCVLM